MEPQHGDVVSVGFADPREKGRTGPFAAPNRDDRVAIRLHGHPYRYVVKVAVSRGSEPRLAELTVIADKGQVVDSAAVRSVPVRRLAHSAAQWIERGGGAFALPGDYEENDSRPENADPRLYEVSWRIEAAIMNGEPVRRTVAQQMNISTATLDRLIAKAKAFDFLDGIELSRRPPPRQRDTTTEENN
ncbi:hypothetical protein [Mycobacterium vicinigordonae]|uniref:Uncharacterized protein n=1 Tax=Mycobacterium vicinigordonae TaxID=1719132 RepID=A0A7D6E014_9MYCO|nr:hypothetical protein [Mycobacterium vicinigordonae]QLL08844.1 hypothetical protein H0P51_08045 [Mycobacterium vicinigordonae]